MSTSSSKIIGLDGLIKESSDSKSGEGSYSKSGSKSYGKKGKSRSRKAKRHKLKR